MNPKEWTKFVRDILAGFFGGVIVTQWMVAYELLKNESILLRIFAPALISVILFIFLIIVLRLILVEK
ncbi:MAG: hypothetical protein NTX24_02625 [Candidatus Pacearchaeota archaeon]|nr:hypothetical protein [Candidatus Pacearchaeota archaeon]